jgi:hypothetical protein
MGHALMENGNGLAVGGMVTQANGTAERRASEAMLEKKAKGLKRDAAHRAERQPHQDRQTAQEPHGDYKENDWS